MQEEAEKKSLKSKLSSIRKASGLSWRARSQPEASERLATLLEEDVVAPESVASSIKEIIAASKQTLQPLTTFILKTIAIATLSLMTACVVRGQIRKRGGICPPIQPDPPDHWNQHKESITIPMSLPALMEGISRLHHLHHLSRATKRF